MSLENSDPEIRKARLDERRELKVKVPVRMLVRLHFVKLTEARAISDIVNQALREYFASHASEFGARTPAVDGHEHGGLLREQSGLDLGSAPGVA